MRRRAFLLASVALASCRSEPELGDADVVRDAPATLDADVTGNLEARTFLSFAGCVPPGKLLHWLVLADGAAHYPIAILAPESLSRLRASLADVDAGAAAAAPPPKLTPLTPDDASKHGVKVGERVRARGVFAPLVYSGTVAATPVYGVCTDQLTPA